MYIVTLFLLSAMGSPWKALNRKRIQSDLAFEMVSPAAVVRGDKIGVRSQGTRGTHTRTQVLGPGWL